MASLSAHIHVPKNGHLLHVDNVESSRLSSVDIRLSECLDVLLDFHRTECLLEAIAAEPHLAGSAIRVSRPLHLTTLFLLQFFFFLRRYHPHPLLSVDDVSSVVFSLQVSHDFYGDIVRLCKKSLIQAFEYLLEVESSAMSSALHLLLLRRYSSS